MRILRIAPAFLLFFLLGNQGLQPDQAYAGCCGCTCIPYMCTCAGKWDQQTKTKCRYCRSADPFLQTNSSLDKSAEQLIPVNESVPSIVAKSDITQQVMELMRGEKCFRDKIALSLLGNARDGQKFVPVIDDNNTLAFLIGADKEK